MRQWWPKTTQGHRHNTTHRCNEAGWVMLDMNGRLLLSGKHRHGFTARYYSISHCIVLSQSPVFPHHAPRGPLDPGALSNPTALVRRLQYSMLILRKRLSRSFSRVRSDGTTRKRTPSGKMVMRTLKRLAPRKRVEAENFKVRSGDDDATTGSQC